MVTALRESDSNCVWYALTPLPGTVRSRSRIAAEVAPGQRHRHLEPLSDDPRSDVASAAALDGVDPPSHFSSGLVTPSLPPATASSVGSMGKASSTTGAGPAIICSAARLAADDQRGGDDRREQEHRAAGLPTRQECPPDASGCSTAHRGQAEQRRPPRPRLTARRRAPPLQALHNGAFGPQRDTLLPQSGQVISRAASGGSPALCLGFQIRRLGEVFSAGRSG